MKITKVETYLVPPRWCFLRITTDEGIEGWGEPVVEGKASTVAHAVHELETDLIGKDPLLIEDIWQVLYRSNFYRGGPVLMSAIAGIDQALWDIKGKKFQAPIHALMGGRVRDKMQVYSWIGGDRPSEVAKGAKEAEENGFHNIKMTACSEMQIVDTHGKVDEAVARVAAIREACPDLGIAIDFHGRVHKPMAKQLARKLQEYDPLFIEEPVLAEHREAFRDIRNHTTIPIATGERMYSRWDFKGLLHDGYVDIIQPDLSHAGGITEVKKIAAMAEAYDVALAPHCPLGPISLASALQIDASCYNAFIQEQSLGIHYNTGLDLLDYLADTSIFKFTNGYVDISEKPGLGLQINEDYLAQQVKIGHNFRNPRWRHTDGSVAEW